MSDTNETAETLIKKHAPEISEQIKQSAKEAWGNEAQFRGNLARGQVLEGFAEHLGLHLQPQEERTLINGRADAVYNRFVIEYEPPGSLTAKDSTKNRHAVGQFKQYIEDLIKVERHQADRMAGVATDGCYFIFGRFRNGVWYSDDPLPITSDSTSRFLASLYLLSTEKALTADNLVRDFGENTNVARMAVSSIYKALIESKNPKVKVIYDQWRQQFSEVCGYEDGSPRLDIRALAKQYGIQESKPNAFQLFFAIHTYYATFIKLLAVQVVHYYVAPKLGTTLPQVASYQTDRLCRYLKDMERGGIFKQLGISNFLEGDFFGWYLEVWDDYLDKGIRHLVSELANYSLITLDADPDQTRDLLKQLYQNVMPKQLRHDLGEYYTPDWLAERVLNQLGFNSESEPKLQEKRLLDPACGSGTFLVLAIKRVKEHCRERAIKPAELLQKILSNIMGFDLNPLAVISARTNYLLAMGDLLQAQRDFEINIPVYLCDSILTPSQAEEKVGDQYRMMGAEEHLYKFKTVVGEFAVPGSLVKAQYIDQLASLVEDCVDAKYSIEDFRKRLVHAFPLVEGKDDLEFHVLEQLYTRIKELDEKAINGIWARIIKNAFAPLFCGQFDYVAGNPPWVNWGALPENYRQNLIPLNQDVYLLFPHTGLSARHGSSEIDISTLMTYVSLDRYLSDTGKLGFVITQTIFKSDAGKGFRRFDIRGITPVSIIHVDDMVKLKPFEGAANRTSVVICEKGKKTLYPVPYTLWSKKTKRVQLPDESPLTLVLEQTVRSRLVAQPVEKSDVQSPWLTGKPKALRALRNILGNSPYQAHVGVHTGGANAVFWVNVIAERGDGLLVVSNLTEGAKRIVESIQTAIESDYVFPLLRGRDVGRWHSEPSAYIIAPQQPDHPDKAVGESELKETHPKTYAYLKHFESIFSERQSGVVKTLMEHGPSYSLYGIKSYTFSDFKVVWREVASFMTAAVVEPSKGKIVLPDHKLTLCAVNSKDEAHYLCSVLNSSLSAFAVNCFAIQTQMSTNVLDYLNVIKFNPKDRTHVGLAALSLQAHEAKAIGDQDTVNTIEKRVDELAAEMWGLSVDELTEIQESLQDLK